MANDIPPPQIPDLRNFTDIGQFTAWWQGHTFGLFIGILSALVVLSVFLKTRSLSATLVAAGVLAAVLGKSWLLLVVALAFAGLLWGAWRRAE